MSKLPISRRLSGWGVLAVLLASLSARAHRLDECLQAALIEIKADEARVQVNLSPGVQVADAFVWNIDRNHDGKISAAEGKDYAKKFVAKLRLSLDERPLTLEFIEADCDSVAELKSGAGNIHVEMRARLARMDAGEHVLSFENHHQSDLSVYLFNAILPKTDAIRISKQERNDNQSTGRIYFSVKDSS
jgi:hypothetical protein